QSRLHARKLRAHYDATMIGAGTFINDNPSLDFRETEFEGRKQNRIVILDPKGKGAEKFKGSNLEKLHAPENIYILTRQEKAEAWQGKGVHVLPWNSNPVGWEVALKSLYENNIYSLFVEGGAYAISQLLQFKRVQKLYMYQAPKILGYGKSWSDNVKFHNVADAITLRELSSEKLEHDLLHTGWF
ncbi:MAG: RibD family protein, partial [Bdellovibrionales bacterium]|nr:RibD family protein [Bdellovibrionales bacterium]NQZ19344.1 RibD family protein [Bdellovibrionales bacterium]